MLEGDFIKRIFNLCIIFCFILNITSCSVDNYVKSSKENNSSQDMLKQETAKELPSTKEIVYTLCSDDFAGRLVGSEGNEKAATYVSEIFKHINLNPLFSESYYEPYKQIVYKKYGLIDENDFGEEKEINNIIGVIKGCNSANAVVISAHFDHIGYQDGKIIAGALDNASGIATLIDIAHILKDQSEKNIFNQDIIIAAFNGEEEAQQGSKTFVNEIKRKYSSLYNINIDCVGGKKAGKISLNNTSKISNKLIQAMKATFKSNGMDFSEVKVKNDTSDQKSFEKEDIPNIYIGQDNLQSYVHNPTDTPDTLNYDEVERISNVICDFIKTNDGKVFKE